MSVEKLHKEELVIVYYTLVISVCFHSKM